VPAGSHRGPLAGLAFRQPGADRDPLRRSHAGQETSPGELCFFPSRLSGLGESTQSASRERVYTAYGMPTYGLRIRRPVYGYVSTCVVRPTAKSNLHTRPWRPATVSAALDNFPSGGRPCPRRRGGTRKLKFLNVREGQACVVCLFVLRRYSF
jgi:hypothetical protein